MKRIFSLTLALVLVLTCVVPASAASVPGQYDVVDLLATGFFPDGELYLLKSASTYTFNWTVTSGCSFNQVYLNIYSASKPSSVTLNGISGTLSYSGAFYQYKFLVNSRINDVQVKVNYSTVANRAVSIGYAVGTVPGQAVISSFTFRSKGAYSSSYTSSTETIPYKGTFASTFPGSTSSFSAQSCQFELVFNSSLSSADYFTIHLVVPTLYYGHPYYDHTDLLEEPSFFLGPNSEHVYPLHVISVDSYEDPPRGLGGSTAWHYIATVDVSGYKLDTLDLDVDFSIFGVRKGDTDTYLFGIEVLSSCFGVYVDQGDSNRGFIPWLNNRFEDIKSWFNTLGSTISTQFSSLKTSLSGWFSSLESKIQAVVNPPKSQDQQEAQDNVDQQVSDMEQFEQSQFGEIQNGTSQLQTDVSAGVNSFVPALAFIGKYVSAVGAGIQDYIVVFMMPIYLGIFFFICNRASGVTHISVFRRKGD